MVNKIYNINLDLRRVTAQAESIPPVVDGDNGNIFVIILTDDGAPVNLSGCKVLCVFSKTDGSTVEQDTEDANVALDDYGITADGTPDEEDTITITSTGISATAAASGTGISSATVDSDKFIEKFPEAGEYEFVYFGTSWMYGMHSVVIGGTNHNVLTVFLKTASFGVGKNNCELQIYSGTVLVTTAQFNFDGRKGIVNEETIQSEDKYPVLVSLINEAANALSLARPFAYPSAVTHPLQPDEPAAVTVEVGTQSTEWTFNLPVPNSITSVALVSGDHSAGTFDTYRITFTDGTHLDFQIWNGADGTGAVLSVNGQTGIVVLTAADVGADASGTAASAVSTHDGSADAHATLFSDKQDTISDLATIRSGAADGTSALAGVAAITEIKVSNPTVGSNWTTTSHASDTDGKYPERLAIPVTGVTSTMIAEVVFGVADGLSGEYSPICECGTGVVYIWAKTQTAPTVLSILVHK